VPSNQVIHTTDTEVCAQLQDWADTYPDFTPEQAAADPELATVDRVRTLLAGRRVDPLRDKLITAALTYAWKGDDSVKYHNDLIDAATAYEASRRTRT